MPTHPKPTLAKKVDLWVTWKRLGVSAVLSVAGFLPGVGPVVSTILHHLAEANVVSSVETFIARRKAPET